MTINPFCPVTDLASLTPDLPVWTMRMSDRRFNLKGVLCEVAWTGDGPMNGHPWLDPFLASPDRVIEPLSMPLSEYLRLHAVEHRPINPNHEHARAEFFRAWREMHGDKETQS